MHRTHRGGGGRMAGVVMGILVAASAGPAVAEDTKIAVVLSPSKAVTHKLKAWVASRIEKPLKQHMVMVTLSAYLQAAKSAGVRDNGLFEPEAVVPAGRGSGASHVLRMEVVGASDASGKKQKDGHDLGVTLVDVATGESLLTKRYPLSGLKLTDEIATQVVADVRASLKAAASHPLPIPELSAPPAAPSPPPAATPAPQEAAPSPLPPPPPAPDTQNAEPEPSPTSPPTSPPTFPKMPPEPPPASQEHPGKKTPPAPSPSYTLPQAESSAESAEEPPAQMERESPGRRRRAGFRLAVAGMGFSREAILHASGNASGGGQPPCYCELAGVHSPVFSGGEVQLDVYPWSWGGSGQWYEGWGLQAHMRLGWVPTELGNHILVHSLVGRAEAGLSYRWVLWNALNAPDLLVQAGYSFFRFPLQGASFPGLYHHSPYGSLAAEMPLSEAWTAVARGTYMLGVFSGDDASLLGTQPTPGQAWRAQAGMRYTWLSGFQISAEVFAEAYHVSFEGPTHLSHATSQYENVTLKDQTWGALASVGLVLF